MQTSADSIIKSVSELARPLSTAGARIGLRLTAAERKTLLTIGDLLLVNGSLLAAVMIWNGFAFSWSSLLAHAKWFITLSIVWSVAGNVLDIYDLARSASVTSILASAGGAALASTLVYTAIPWLTPPILRRFYVLGFVSLTLSMVLAWRVFYAQALVQPAFRRRALVLGLGKAARDLVRAVAESSQVENANPFRGTGYQIVGLVADQVEPTCGEAGVEPADMLADAGLPDHGDDNGQEALHVVGRASQLASLARQHRVDEIVVAPDQDHGLSPEAYECLLDCRELGLQVNDLSTVYERMTGRLPVEYARRDLHLILGPADSTGSHLYGAIKRLVDLLVALVGLVVLGLAIPWVALANALWSPGPLFYRQQRVGQGGHPIVMLKFRSMIPEAEKESGAVWCGDQDSRITPVGRLMRKTRLDELPQVLNILRGEMSLVGPRPERPHFVGQLDRALPLYRARHAVKPGLTGWAQVHYEYGNSIEDARIKLEYDLYYVRHASLYLDLLTVLQTVRVVLGLMGQ